MSVRIAKMLRHHLASGAISLLWCANIFAQTSPPPQVRYSAYWSTMDGNNSQIIVRNANRVESVSISVSLRLSSGDEFVFDELEVEAQGNRAVDVRQLLEKRGVRAAWGSATITYRQPNNKAVMVETIVEDVRKSISYTVPSYERAGYGRRLYGLYWTPAPTTELYVALQNTSGSPLTVRPSLQTAEGIIEMPPVSLSAHQSTVLELPEDARLRGLWARERSGAFILTYDGPGGALNTAAWLEDEHSGFSTSMTLADPSAVKTRSLYGTQMFLTDAETNGDGNRVSKTESRMLLKNTTDGVVPLRGDFIVETAIGSFPVALPVKTMRAGEFIEIDLNDLLGRDRAALVASVRIDYEGPLGAIVGRSFGHARERTFGYYAALESYTYAAFNGILWSLDGGRDTVFSVANFAPVADDVRIELFHTGGSTQLPPFRLERNESKTFSLREMARNAGIRLPASNGGYRISGLSSTDGQLLTKEHVIDLTGKTSWAMYGSGVYVLAFNLYPPSISVNANGGTQSVEGLVTFSDAYQEYRCDNMATGSGSIATVGFSGCPRTLTGAYSGSTTLTAQVSGPQQGGGTGVFNAQAPVQVKWNVNLNVSNTSLTVNRSGGSVNLIATATTTAGQYTGTKSFTIGISAPANPSGVVLDSGGSGANCSMSMTAGSSQNCTLSVATAMSNVTSGTLTYTVTLSGLDENAVPTGSPKTVTVQTVP